MTRLEELTLKLADEALIESESEELERLLSEDDAREQHLEILQVEAGLREGRQRLDLAPAIMAHLREQREEAVADRVMSGIKDSPRPLWQRDRRVQDKKVSSVLWLIEKLRNLSGLPAVALRLRPLTAWLVTSCMVVLVVMLIWLFGTTVGQPVLADVRGEGLLLERGGKSLRAHTGMALESGDMLRTGLSNTVVIGFVPEKTRMAIEAGSDLRLTSTPGGKNFDLRRGMVEVLAARQRPFHPMKINTPYAVVRVVGTKFVLNVSSNATRLDVMEGKVRFERTSDQKMVRVSAGHYAVAAADYELASLPQTGGLLCEWWDHVQGNRLDEDPRFPQKPDGRNVAADFELKIEQTNQFAVRFCGYVHPPVTGDYNFWMERPPVDFGAVGSASLMMSPTERTDEAVVIAMTGKGKNGSPNSPYVAASSTTAPPPIPLVAGHRYYIEARIVVVRGEAQLSIVWQPPGQTRQVLAREFLSPLKSK